MKLNAILKNLRNVAISVGITMAGFGGFNYIENHNKVTKRPDMRIYSKVDGILSKTCVEINNSGSVIITRNGFFSYNSLTDVDGDGNVDSAYLSDNGTYSGIFDRPEHFHQYSGLQRRVNEDFEKQMKRFGPLIEGEM